jgi:hypothetical protein
VGGPEGDGLPCPEGIDGKTVTFPFSRTGKRVSLMACISADGTSVRPSTVIQRATFQEEAATFGLSPGTIEIYAQRKSFIDQDTYQQWFRDSFLPEVRRRRERWKYQGPAFLLADNWIAHCGMGIDELYAANDVVPIFLPPYSPDNLQSLDFCMFGPAKLGTAKINKTAANI